MHVPPNLPPPLSPEPCRQGLRAPDTPGKGTRPSALPMHPRVRPAAPSLPPVRRDDAVALAWVRANVGRDPDVVAIFDEASHTSWKPLIDFVRWAVAHNLLQSLPSATEVQR